MSNNNEWFVYKNSSSKTNSLWRSFYICKNQNKLNTLAPTTITVGSKNMKKNTNFKTNILSTTDEIQQYVDFISQSKKKGIKIIGVHLYDNLFQKIKTFKPSNNKQPDEYYEIQLCEKQYNSLLKWDNIPFEKDELDENSKITSEEITKLEMKQKEKLKEYNKRPDVKAKKKEYQIKYVEKNREEVNRKMREYKAKNNVPRIGWLGYIYPDDPRFTDQIKDLQNKPLFQERLKEVQSKAT